MARNFEHILAETIRKAGWRIQQPRRAADAAAGIFSAAKGRRYAFEIRASSEGRRDRLISLLGQRIQFIGVHLCSSAAKLKCCTNAKTLESDPLAADEHR